MFYCPSLSKGIFSSFNQAWIRLQKWQDWQTDRSKCDMETTFACHLWLTDLKISSPSLPASHLSINPSLTSCSEEHRSQWSACPERPSPQTHSPKCQPWKPMFWSWELSFMKPVCVNITTVNLNINTTLRCIAGILLLRSYFQGPCSFSCFSLPLLTSRQIRSRMVIIQ